MAAGDDELTVDHVRQVAPGAKVVVYSGHEPHAAQQFVRGEPDLYLRKGDEPEHLIDALRELRD
jgi:DNA-binding NarL/FixJ family response regulator